MSWSGPEDPIDLPLDGELTALEAIDEVRVGEACWFLFDPFSGVWRLVRFEDWRTAPVVERIPQSDILSFEGGAQWEPPHQLWMGYRRVGLVQEAGRLLPGATDDRRGLVGQERRYVPRRVQGAKRAFPGAAREARIEGSARWRRGARRAVDRIEPILGAAPRFARLRRATATGPALPGQVVEVEWPGVPGGVRRYLVADKGSPDYRTGEMTVVG